MCQIHNIDVPITSGIWGGTYLIADPFGKSLRRIWRFYCIVNLPQNSPLDKHENLEKLVSVYFKTFAEAFLPYGLALDLKMWGGRLPHSNKKRPTITMHGRRQPQNQLAEADHRLELGRVGAVHHLRFGAAGEGTQGQSGPRTRPGTDRSQDHQVPPAERNHHLPHPRASALAGNSRARRTPHRGYDPDLSGRLVQSLQIRDLYHKILENALVYGYEQTLADYYSKYELDVGQVQDWPVEKINWVTDELQAKLIPPIQNIFATFKSNLDATPQPQAG